MNFPKTQFSENPGNANIEAMQRLCCKISISVTLAYSAFERQIIVEWQYSCDSLLPDLKNNLAQD